MVFIGQTNLSIDRARKESVKSSRISPRDATIPNISFFFFFFFFSRFSSRYIFLSLLQVRLRTFSLFLCLSVRSLGSRICANANGRPRSQFSSVENLLETMTSIFDSIKFNDRSDKHSNSPLDERGN